MFEKILKKMDFIVGLLPIGAVFGLAYFIAGIEIKDLDLWLHIGVGRYLSAHNFLPPSFDFLSCTIAGKHWINHEWLFQLIVYHLYNNFGVAGLHMMQKTIVVMTMFILLFIGYSKDKQITLTISLCMVLFLYLQRFTIRPDLFSLLFFAFYIYILALHINKRWAILVLLGIQILWSNIHGFFFFGPMFILIGLISEWIKRNIRLPCEWNETGNLTDEEYFNLKKIFVVVLLACFINPQGIEGALYPVKVFLSLSGDSKIFFSYIEELQRPIGGGAALMGWEFIHYKLLILLSFVSFVFNRRRIDISALLLWLFFLVFSLKAMRNLSFFAFAAYLAIVSNTFHLSYENIIPIRFIEKKFKYITLIVMKLIILIWILVFFRTVAEKNYYDFDNYERKSEFGDVSLRVYPYHAVDFLVENGIKGNFFNDFNSGAYLVGRTYPDIKVFIDGRTEVYGGAFFLQYQKIWDAGGGKIFDSLVDQYDLTGVFLNSAKQHISEYFLRYVYQHEDWVLVYLDYDAVIFLKNVPQNAAVIQRFKIDPTRLKAKKVDLKRLGSASALPTRHYYRAYTLEALDFDDAALEELNFSLKIKPDVASVYQLRGKIYGKRNEHEKAFEDFRLASLYAPEVKINWYNLAFAYLNTGDIERAVENYEIIVRAWPNEAKGYFYLAKAYAMKRDYPHVLSTLRVAHQMDSRDIIDILKIGDIVFRNGDYPEAVKIYAMAKMAKKRSSWPYLKLSYVYEAQEDYQSALKELDVGLGINPEDKDLINRIRAIESQLK